uniref:Aminoglycoside phosphotransferase domain-containing protein n=1 Tax=viral metagenome TaxID=1070528 RepID=A0A6C0EBM1_9ZZZZ
MAFAIEENISTYVKNNYIDYDNENPIVIEKLVSSEINKVYKCTNGENKVIVKSINAHYISLLPLISSISSPLIPKIHTFDMKNKLMIEQYIDAKTLTNDDIKDNIIDIIDAIYHLQQDINTKITLSFNCENHYERLLKYLRHIESSFDFKNNHIDLEIIKRNINDYKKFISDNENDIKLCHNDVHSLNILKCKNQYYIIDFEFIGMNHYLYDFVNFIEEYDITNETKECMFPEKVLLKLMELFNIKKMNLVNLIKKLRIYINTCWLLWALNHYIREHSDDMLKYAIKRYERLLIVMRV